VALREALEALAAPLQIAAPRAKTLESCYKRVGELRTCLAEICEDHDARWIRWYETHRKTFTLHRTPLDIAGEFRRFMGYTKATWVFTSATLSVAGRFEHFARQLGLGDARGARWESPFDYASQALFYHPRGMPQPSAPEFIQALIEVVVPVLQASQGRAFLLFTSHSVLQQVAARLAPRIDYPLLVQGERPKATLLETFRAHGHAVLLGTASFWEGVDVKGEALSCVIIDKLPFAAPGDPVLKARLDAIKRRGRNPFIDYQLPAAVIALRQGAGRLIRDATDRGVLVVCDPRLLQQSYGRLFLDSLPPMRRTRDIADVQNFFAETL